MPRGAAVIEYRGKRGTVWRIKYADADGKQAMETVGAERDGFTRKQAEAELRERLVRVERRAYRRPSPVTFAVYAATWFEEGKTRRRWAKRTVIQYRSILKRLGDTFGSMPLGAIRPRHVAEYVAEQGKQFEASTVSRDVSVLHDVFATAMREELIDSNPAAGAEHPKLARRRWRILEPVEIRKVAKAFDDEQARTIFLTLVLTGIRRHELQELRWRDVDLVDCVLRVRDSKTEEGIRAIALSPALAEALWQHERGSAYQGEDDRVFCHPERGTRYSEKLFAEQFRAALKAAGITDYVRPFHDLRHTSLTNEAASGSTPIALMAKAGHTDMKVTRRYLHLAGIVFPAEAQALERRLLGGPGRGGPEADVVVHGIGHSLVGDGDDDIAPAELVLGHLVDDELGVGRVTETQIRPALVLDVDVVDEHDRVESSTHLSKPQTISAKPNRIGNGSRT
jgi:integrase